MKLILLFSFLFGSAANACPDLSGTYEFVACKEGYHSCVYDLLQYQRQLVITQNGCESITIAKLSTDRSGSGNGSSSDETSYIPDGKPYTWDVNGELKQPATLQDANFTTLLYGPEGLLKTEYVGSQKKCGLDHQVYQKECYKYQLQFWADKSMNRYYWRSTGHKSVPTHDSLEDTYIWEKK